MTNLNTDFITPADRIKDLDKDVRFISRVADQALIGTICLVGAALLIAVLVL